MSTQKSEPTRYFCGFCPLIFNSMDDMGRHTINTHFKVRSTVTMALRVISEDNDIEYSSDSPSLDLSSGFRSEESVTFRSSNDVPNSFEDQFVGSCPKPIEGTRLSRSRSRAGTRTSNVPKPNNKAAEMDVMDLNIGPLDKMDPFIRATASVRIEREHKLSEIKCRREQNKRDEKNIIKRVIEITNLEKDIATLDNEEKDIKKKWETKTLKQVDEAMAVMRKRGRVDDSVLMLPGNTAPEEPVSKSARKPVAYDHAKKDGLLVAIKRNLGVKDPSSSPSIAPIVMDNTTKEKRFKKIGGR